MVSSLVDHFQLTASFPLNYFENSIEVRGFSDIRRRILCFPSNGEEPTCINLCLRINCSVTKVSG